MVGRTQKDGKVAGVLGLWITFLATRWQHFVLIHSMATHGSLPTFSVKTTTIINVSVITHT
jgi:hypothetical protein